MAIKLTSTAEAAKSNGVKALTYGKAGRGKTVLVATAPNPVLISAESGMLSLSPENIARIEPVLGRKLPRNIPAIEIQSLNDLVEAFNWCESSAECKSFETICLDSITEIAQRVLAYEKSVTINGKLRDPRQAYGELTDKVSKIMREFRDLSGKNVYFSAQQEFVKDDASGATLYQPSMPGTKLGQQIPYWFDEVFQLEIGKAPATENSPAYEFRYLRTQPDFSSDAKDRSGALDAMERPDLAYIFAKIRGETFTGEPL